MRQVSRYIMNLSIAVVVWSGAWSVHAQTAPAQIAPEPGTATHTAAASSSRDVRVKSTRAKSEPYVEGAAAVPASETRRIPNRGLLSTGSVLLIASYVPSVITAAARDDVSDNLYYPVAGPWMEIAQEDPSTGGKTLLAIDGVVQGLGTLMMVSSFFIPERQTQSWYLLGNQRFHLTPKAGRSYGLTAAGRF